MAYIYKATNDIDDMIYIGKTNDIARRIREHKNHAKKDGGAFHEAIRQYGYEHFDFDIIEKCEDSISDERERYYIAQAREKYGADKVYNYTDGGLGGQTHDVTGVNNPQYGRKWTDEEKQHVSDMLKGRPKPEGFGAKVSQSLKGKPKTREHVLKRCLGISVINEETQEILRFDSRADLSRTLHCDPYFILKGGKTKQGYKLYSAT